MPKLADYIVKTKYVAVDKMSAAYKAMGSRAKAFGNKTSAAFDKATRKASVFKGALAALGVAAAMRRVVMGVSRGLREVASQWIDFDSAVTQAAAKFPERIRRGTLAFKQLGDTARQVGATTQFTAAEAAGGLNFLAMAGFSAQQAMKLLPGVTNLATVGHMDLARATDIASDALGAFGLMTKNTTQLDKNFTRINDVMAKTITSTNVNLEQLFETMKFAGPVATQAGASIETFAAAAGELAQAGIKGSLAGTALRTMFTRLAKTKTAKAFKKFGATVEKTSDGTIKLFDSLGNLKKAFDDKKMGKAARLAAIDVIFGRRAIAGVSVLLQAGSKRLKAFEGDLVAAGGASKTMAVDIRKSLENRLAELKSSLIEVGFKFIEAFGGKSGRTIEELIKAVRKFDVKPIVKALKDVIQVFKDIKRGVEVLWPAIETIGKAWLVYKGILIAVKIAQWALNASMLANPIGLIIAAVVALGAAVMLLIKHWDTVRAGLDVVGTTWSMMIEKAIMWTKELAATIINGPIKVLNVLIDLINKASTFLGGGELIKPIELIDKAKFTEGNREVIEHLQREQKEGMRKVMMTAIKSDKSFLALANRQAAGRAFAKTRSMAKMVTPGMLNALKGETSVTPEFEPPMSGGQALPEVQPMGRGQSLPEIKPTTPQRGSEHRLTIEGAPKGSELKETRRGAPGLDIRLLGEAS